MKSDSTKVTRQAQFKVKIRKLSRVTSLVPHKKLQWSLSCTFLSCKSHSFVRPVGTVSSRILYMALYGRLFLRVRPSQFYVQVFESRRGRITEISLYCKCSHGKTKGEKKSDFQKNVAFKLILVNFLGST